MKKIIFDNIFDLDVIGPFHVSGAHFVKVTHFSFKCFLSVLYEYIVTY